VRKCHPLKATAADGRINHQAFPELGRSVETSGRFATSALIPAANFEKIQFWWKPQIGFHGWM
jgi:hypothetical protein